MPRPAPEYTVAWFEAEFTSLTRDDAVPLGEVGIAVIREWNRNLAIEVRVGGELGSRAQLGNTGEENAVAIAGKVATVTALGVSSLFARRRNEVDPAYDGDFGNDARLWEAASRSSSTAHSPARSRPRASRTSWTTKRSQRPCAAISSYSVAARS